ncbi:HEAT repeat domain-containing protein [Candidatus Uhrbacteria bacterium]|nr:HEAT repeat domain-containing protein [Candidatus Uhrbacteria bacterium]
MPTKTPQRIAAFFVVILIFGIGVYILSDYFRFNREVTVSDVIEGFDGSDLNNSFYQLDKYILSPSKHAEAAQNATAYLGSSDPEILFAAVYLIVNTGDALYAPYLVPLLSHDDVLLRTVVAGRLIGWGEMASIPVLIESLDSDLMLPYADPPRRLSELAQEALPYYTKQDYISRNEWQQWWSQVKEQLIWNASTQQYGL